MPVPPNQWTDPRTWYLLICRVCADGDPLTMPFESAEDRGKWAAAHTAAAGHDRWLVFGRWRDNAAGRTIYFCHCGADLADASPRQNGTMTELVCAGCGEVAFLRSDGGTIGLGLVRED